MKDFGKEVQWWRKQGCQLLKIKSKGQADIVVGMVWFLILLAVILFSFRISQYMVVAAGVEDALAASNLASAVIDIEEYGRTHNICISDAGEAFEIFREALCYNLQLDQYLNSSNANFMTAPLEIKEYIVYNVQGDVVRSYFVDGEGKLKRQETGTKGMVHTPDGVCVETATIYSRVGFWVEGLMGQQFYGEKEQSIDITR